MKPNCLLEILHSGNDVTTPALLLLYSSRTTCYNQTTAFGLLLLSHIAFGIGCSDSHSLLIVLEKYSALLTNNEVEFMQFLGTSMFLIFDKIFILAIKA